MADRIEGAVRNSRTASAVLENLKKTNPLDHARVGSMEIGFGKNIDLRYLPASDFIFEGERVVFYPKPGESFIASFFIDR
jgi:hypothetical protein